jgi:hypothetical protein
MEILVIFGCIIAYYAIRAFQNDRKKDRDEFLYRVQNARVITCSVGYNFSVTFTEADPETAIIAMNKAKAYIDAHPNEKTIMEYRWPDIPD